MIGPGDVHPLVDDEPGDRLALPARPHPGLCLVQIDGVLAPERGSTSTGGVRRARPRSSPGVRPGSAWRSAPSSRRRARGWSWPTSTVTPPSAPPGSCRVPCRGARVDVRDADAFRALVDDIGEIDLLCNNAGITMGGPTHELTAEHWERAIDVNIRGVVNGVLAAYPAMVERGRGAHPQHRVGRRPRRPSLRRRLRRVEARRRRPVPRPPLRSCAPRGPRQRALPRFGRDPDPRPTAPSRSPPTPSEPVTARAYLAVVRQKPVPADDVSRGSRSGQSSATGGSSSSRPLPGLSGTSTACRRPSSTSPAAGSPAPCSASSCGLALPTATAPSAGSVRTRRAVGARRTRSATAGTSRSPSSPRSPRAEAPTTGGRSTTTPVRVRGRRGRPGRWGDVLETLTTIELVTLLARLHRTRHRCPVSTGEAVSSRPAAGGSRARPRSPRRPPAPAS